MAITRTNSPLTLATSVTAATRPTSPPVGTVIMVSDRGNRVEWYDGTNWRYGLSNVSDKKQRTTDKTTTSTTAVDFDTATDITLPAVAGDVIEVALSGQQQNSGANNNNTDVATIVSGSPVNYISGTAFGSTGVGVVCWTHRGSGASDKGGSFYYTLVSGDISGGLVTLRLRIKVTAGTGTWYGHADYPHAFMARNLGPCASGALTAG